MTPVDHTVWGALDSACASNPDKELLIVDGARYTYRRVHESAARLAESFANWGVAPGDVIALWLPNGFEWITTFFAAARVGAITFGINTRLRMDETAGLLQQSQAKVFVVSHVRGSSNYVDTTHQLIPGLRESDGSVESDRFPSLNHVVCTGEAAVPGMHRWQDLLQETSSYRPAHADASSVALLQSTSGSTAKPKCVKLRHESLTRNGFNSGERMGLNQHDKVFAPGPFFHVGGLVTGLLDVVTHRATLVTMAHYEAGKALEVLEKEQCTARLGIDTMYQRELEHPDFPSRDLRHLRKGAFMGAAHVFRAACTKMGITDLISIYGLSEGSPIVATTAPTDSIDVRATTVGKPHEGVEVKIVDLQTREPVPQGETGEICVRGWNVMEGYFNDPAATAQALDADGWLRTGDLGRWDASSYLVFAGRAKDVIRVGGENVSAQEVENVLLSHPAIRIAQVVAVQDRDLGEVPFAFIESHPDASWTQEEMANFCTERLARFKTPREFHLVREWPMTGVGKIQKVTLRDWAAEIRRKQ
ncbi:MAG: AMP-binding protein [Pseudomonadota bacterium]|nr:AMP-binding protein [Pseudomonadota bacterium]